MSRRKSARIQRRVGGVDYRNIEEDTLQNDAYRRVIYTKPNQFQNVLMSLEPHEKIPGEVHPHTVQFVRVESGHGRCIVGRGRERRELTLHDGISVTIPNRLYHYFENTSDSEPLKMYVIYTPPEHTTDCLQQRE